MKIYTTKINHQPLKPTRENRKGNRNKLWQMARRLNNVINMNKEVAAEDAEVVGVDFNEAEVDFRTKATKTKRRKHLKKSTTRMTLTSI